MILYPLIFAKYIMSYLSNSERITLWLALCNIYYFTGREFIRAIVETRHCLVSTNLIGTEKSLLQRANAVRPYYLTIFPFNHLTILRLSTDGSRLTTLS